MRAVGAIALALIALTATASEAAAGKPVHDVIGDDAGVALIGGLVFDQASGELLAQDVLSNSVVRLDANGNVIGQIGPGSAGTNDFSFYDGFLGLESQLALNESDSSLYVPDLNNNLVKKFDPAGSFVAEFGQAGNGDLSRPRGVAVAPDGSVYVSDTDNSRIAKFTSVGVLDTSWDGDGFIGAPGSAEGELSSPTDLAVDTTGRLYVVDSGNSRVQRFAADGTFDEVVADDLAANFQSPSHIAIDRTNDHLYVAATTTDFTEQRLFEYGPSDASPIDSHGGGNAGDLAPRGLALDPGGPIYVTDLPGFSSGQIVVLDEPAASAPAVVVDPVATFDATTASFSGTVDPVSSDMAVSWRIEYSGDGGTSWTTAGNGDLAAGDPLTQVSAEVEDLDPNHTYDVRLVANKGFGITGTDATSFTTDTAPPLVMALAAGVPTDTAVWLGAEVNPQSSPTTYYVEYALASDTTYAQGVRVPAAPEIGDAGSGGRFTTVTELATSLEPGTAYRFRVVATNPTGTTVGPDRTFTTRKSLPAPPAGRGYEMVSPLDKNGEGIDPHTANIETFSTSMASPDGERVAYGSKGQFADTVAASLTTQYRSERTAAGWTTRALTPPLDTTDNSSAGNAAEILDLSLTLDAAVVRTNRPLTAGAGGLLNGRRGIYLADYAGSPQYRLLSVPAGPIPTAFQPHTAFEYQAASRDFSTIAFKAKETPLIAGAPDLALYVSSVSSGGPELISILPDGAFAATPNVGAREAGTGNQYYPGDDPVSGDGNRIYFSDGDGSIGEKPIYLRERGDLDERTVAVTRSERAGDDPDAVERGVFHAAVTSDGSAALFSSSARLTDDSRAVPFEENLYLWRVEPDGDGRHLQDLTTTDPDGADVLGLVASDDDLKHVYFAANGRLTDDAIKGDCPRAGDPQGTLGQRCNLYYWSAATGVRHVGAISGKDRSMWSVNRQVADRSDLYRSARLSDDGSKLLFESARRLAGSSTEGVTQVYRYDAATHELACVSCPSSAGQPSSNATLSPVDRSPTSLNASTPGHLPRNLSADGRRAFFTTASRLLAADTNGKTDVYMWEDGELALISSGTGSAGAEFIAASDSGDDVFFTTRQRLVGFDVDDQVDLYDARVGGGFGEQTLPPECAADECQDKASGVPPAQAPGSQSSRGHGNVEARGSYCSLLAPSVRQARTRALKLGKQARKASGKRARRLKQRAKRARKKARQAERRLDSCRAGGNS